MSRPITEYTTYDDVRAALGVSVDDLEDSTLALDLYADMLDVEFEEVSATFAATYQSVKAVDDPSEAQAKFLKASRLFATYAVAKHCCGSLPLFAAKQVTDSKVAVQRFDSPYKDAVKAVLDQYGRMRNRLAAAMTTLSVSSQTKTAKTYFAVVSPDVDPITGS